MSKADLGAVWGARLNISADRLRSMPADEIARRQRALARGARRLQYAADDIPGDAYETLLAGALGLSRDLGRVDGAL